MNSSFKVSCLLNTMTRDVLFIIDSKWKVSVMTQSNVIRIGFSNGLMRRLCHSFDLEMNMNIFNSFFTHPSLVKRT